jgi:hypothetical protein
MVPGYHDVPESGPVKDRGNDDLSSELLGSAIFREPHLRMEMFSPRFPRQFPAKIK